MVRRFFAAALVVLTLGRTARAQKDVLDNITILGARKTLRTPAVEQVPARPAEKIPSVTYEDYLREPSFHRPAQGREHPHTSLLLQEPHPLLLKTAETPSLSRISVLAGPPPADSRPGGEGPTIRLPEPDPPLPLPPAPEGDAELGSTAIAGLDEPGPPHGLTLDAAIDRLIHCNRALQTLVQEIPQAQADVLTASLHENPMIYSSANEIPYGKWEAGNPFYRHYPVVIVYPVDLTGRRKARIQVAVAARHSLEARYQDEVRKHIGELQTAFVEVLAARATVRMDREALGELDAMLGELDARGRAGEQATSDRRKLVLERRLTEMALKEAGKRLHHAKQDLAAMLEIPFTEADAVELSGPLRDLGPPPPADAMIQIALAGRPDLIAHRFSVRRAQAMERQEKTRILRDSYLLYEPWGGLSNTTRRGDQAGNVWSLGFFVEVPIYDRNQGNVRRARIEISKMATELSYLERKAIDEVAQAAERYYETLESVQELERDILTVACRERAVARRRLLAGEIGVDSYLSARRSENAVARHYRESVVEHRQAMLELNTAVGRRVLP